MEIELKKIKIVDEMSDETTCFCADVWIDGAYVGSAENAGSGGPNLYRPHGLEDVLQKHAESLGPVEFAGTKLDRDADMVVSELLEAHRLRKELRRRLMFVEKSSGKLRETKVFKAAVLADLLKPENRETTKARLGGDVEKILNLMPFECALKLWNGGEG